jgi:UDP-N-acetylmuramoylalanine--D-glutamate ligase
VTTAIPDLADARVVVLGLGRFGGGLGVSRWLLGQGAAVVVTDRLPRAQLGDAVGTAELLGAQLAVGGHDDVDLSEADMLVVNPAVPLTAPLVCEARDRGLVVTSEIALLMERWPGPMLGVTGSNGKSTTVGLAHAILESAGVPAVRGGNLGGSLLGQLAEATAETVAVLELSSFMLELLAERGADQGQAIGPEVAVITNLTPNHLDRHGSMEAYCEAKAAILARARHIVLPLGDAWLEPLANGLPGDRSGLVRWFGDIPDDPSAPQPDLGVDVAGHLVNRRGRRVLDTRDMLLPGRMNRWDAAAATLAVAALLGNSERAEKALPGGLEGYQAPPHRLQQVACSEGIRWVDDSVSTTPESTAASLEALEGGPCLLIAGGRDKGLDPAPLVNAARSRARTVLTIGEEGAELAQRLNRAGVAAEQVETVDAAVERAATLARAGDTVLLSPGYSSHDQFAHFEERAASFCAAVRGLGPLRSLS